MKPFAVFFLMILTMGMVRGEYPELVKFRETNAAMLQETVRRLANTDPKFKGVQAFAQFLGRIVDFRKVDLPQLTYRSKAYWRAMLEMAPSDPSILLVHAHLHGARGEASFADVYILLATLTMDPRFQPTVDAYLAAKQALDRRASIELGKGVKLHDEKKYDEAIRVFDSVIEQYPGSATAYYEKSFSVMMKEMAPGKSNNQANPLETATENAQRKALLAECRKRNPFEWTAYQGSDKEVLARGAALLNKVLPFYGGKVRNVEGLKAFADGCEEMGLFDIAAHLRWKLVMLDAKNTSIHLARFLDLLDKCGCPDVAFFREQLKPAETVPQP